MTALLFALSPFVVSGLTSLIKRLPVLANMSDGPFTWFTRFIVLLLSFGAVVGSYMSTGILDIDTLSTLTLTLLTFLGATGVHFLGKKK